jgi:hypothetical protein
MERNDDREQEHLRFPKRFGQVVQPREFEARRVHATDRAAGVERRDARRDAHALDDRGDRGEPASEVQASEACPGQGPRPLGRDDDAAQAMATASKRRKTRLIASAFWGHETWAKTMGAATAPRTTKPPSQIAAARSAMIEEMRQTRSMGTSRIPLQ